MTDKINWYDTEQGIREALSRGLVGFDELRRERHAAGHDRKERLTAWSLLGRYWLGSYGDTRTATVQNITLPTVQRGAPGDFYTTALRGIASATDICERCGEGWTLQDAHDFEIRNDRSTRHLECAAFEVHERVSEEFGKVVSDVGLDPSDLRAIRNGYGSGDWRGPWFLIKKSRLGEIRIGWRKRVIEITWSDGPDGREVFEGESVTKNVSLVHAYGYDDATRYLRMLATAIPFTDDDVEAIGRLLMPSIKWENIRPKIS